MPEETTATPESIRSEVATLDGTPFGAGETQADRAAKREAIYKKVYPPESETAEQDDATGEQQGDAAKSEALTVDWGDAPDEEVSKTDGELRQSMQGYFGEIGMSGEQATALLGIARRACATELTEEEWHEKEIATESQLRREWGKDYERNVAKAYALADAFESRFSHADLKKAIDNGLWIDADVLRTLAGVANARNGIRADIHAMRAELLKANQGSPRYRELTAALERHYQALHGTGRA